jgi:methyltransferase (TIGR00027 family)
MRKSVGLLLYGVIQVLFIPLGIIGAILIFYRQMYVSRRFGVSSTAIEILNGRWTMDQFGLRKDLATLKLFNVLPNTTSAGQWLALFPLYLLKLISGQNLIYPTIKDAPDATIFNLVTTRTVIFDNLIGKSLKQSEQFVVMGAGFDMRNYGHLINDSIQLFELDKKETQAFKRKYLAKANLDSSRVHFVDVDFTNESWSEKLTKAGYNQEKVTTFLWEGVTLYLSEDDVRKMLSEIQANAGKGSVVIVDFYARDFIEKKLAKGSKVLKRTNEFLGYGIDFQGKSSHQLKSLVEDAHMTLGQVEYMGSNTKSGPWMAVCELLCR